MSAPFVLDALSHDFPAVELACIEPNGLLAIGGDLSAERLINAYRHGVFPWFNEDQPILWWSPDPRAVIFPEKIRISKSLGKILRQQRFHCSMDRCFGEVIQACSEPRKGQDGTWILPVMQQAYMHLHQLGVAHSVEVWSGQKLVGGLYGVALNGVFSGESMFSRISNASKVALVKLAELAPRHDIELIDCQMHSDHLRTMGSELITRAAFTGILNKYCDIDQKFGKWDDSLSTK